MLFLILGQDTIDVSLVGARQTGTREFRTMINSVPTAPGAGDWLADLSIGDACGYSFAPKLYKLTVS